MTSPPAAHRRSILLFALSFFFYSASLGIMNPLLQVFLKGKGYSAALIGLLLGCYELSAVFGPIVLGALGDRTQQFRHIMTASILVVCVLFVAQYYNASMVIAFLLIAPMGFFFKSNMSLIDAYASHTLPDFERNYGKARIAGSLGFVASAVVIQLTGWIHPSSPSSIVVGFSILAVVYAVTAQMLPRTRARRQAKPPRLSVNALRAFPSVFWACICVVFLMRFSMAAHYNFLSLFVMDRFNVDRVTGLWAIGPLVEAPFILFSGYLIRRFSISRLLIVSLVAGSVRLLVYSLSPSIGPIYAAQLLHGFTYGLLHTSSVAFIRRWSPPEYRGIGLALYFAIGFGTAGFLGSSVGGSIVDALGYNWLYTMYGLLPLVAAIVVFVNRVKFDEVPPPRQAPEG